MSDLIYRQDVIELVENSYYNLAESMEDTWAMVSDVEKLPSAQPERLTGKWLRSGNCIFPYECDQCGDTNERATPFCPNCGADMKKERVTMYKHNGFTGMISFNK